MKNIINYILGHLPTFTAGFIVGILFVMAVWFVINVMFYSQELKESKEREI